MAKKLTERQETLLLAEKLLDEPNCDPDDDLRMLSRQLLRTQENVAHLEQIVHRQEKALQDVDWQGLATTDLINVNRDQMLNMHEEAIRRIQRLLVQARTDSHHPRAWSDVSKAIDVINILNQFHPMHESSFSGWPEGSE